MRLLCALFSIFLLPTTGLASTPAPAPALISAAQRSPDGHQNGVTSLVFSPDGSTLASVGRDSVVRLYDIATGQDRRVLQGHENPIRAVAFSPDGKRLASVGEDTQVFLWDVVAGKLLKTFAGHTGFVNSVAFSSDGTTIVTGGEDTRIILWNVATGQARRVLRGHAGGVTDVAFSPDGKTLVSSSRDKTMRLWDAAAGTQRRALTGHTSAVTSVAFVPGGTAIASASADKTVRLWDATSGAMRRSFTGPTKSVNAVSISPDGKTIAGGSDDDSIDLWDAATGKVQKTLKKVSKGFATIAFSPDGKTLASGAKDGTIVLWDVATGTPRAIIAPAATAGSAAKTSGTSLLSAATPAAAALAPTDGPGGPILVITSASNPFSTYYAEILRNEGFDEFAVADISAVSAATLSGYDLAILGQMTLSASQVTMLSNWVDAGGNLIAMRPDKQLASLLGLADAAATLTNGYLLADTSQAPGNGIVNQTIQFHGTADRYTLSGASSVATLYSNASTATASPAVSLRSVGTSGGQAAAFTFDLARSLVYMRQGNPAWAAQERDGFTPIRPDDLFFGASATDPQADWVDFSKIAIPQADEQQRLLANMIIQMNLDKKPLPRFWYLPFGKKAAVVMSGDDHGNGGTAGRFDAYSAASPSGCSVANWECVRSTSYVYPGTPLTDAQAAAYTAQGFEVGLHINTNCADFTPSSLETFYVQQLSSWIAQFPSEPAPITQRHHCIVWSDWLTAAKTMLNHGMRLDASYYYWPPNWIQDRPGLFSGTAMPMRLVDTDGTMLDIYEAVTQMTDESGQSYPFTVDTLLDRAIGSEGYYGVYTVNAHTDQVDSAVSDAVLASAQSRGVPIISSKQLLTWLDGRNSSSFGGLAWNGSALSFTVARDVNANGLQAMLPRHTGSSALVSITRSGTNVPFTVQTIKGIEYAFFTAAAGSYTATYGVDTTSPQVTATAPSNGATAVSPGTAATATFSEPLSAATVSGSTFELRDASNTLVAATVTYDAATNTAKLQPGASLAYATTYTAKVKGGASGVTDLAGNPLASDVTWSFTTANPPPCPCSIWSSSAAPANPSTNDPNAVELGVKVQSDIAGWITGIRFYKGTNNTGTHVGNLWSTGGQLLGTATFGSEAASGWQTVSFASPVAIAANTVYVASYHTNAGNYAYDPNFFATSGVDNAPLHALRDGVSGGDGVYTYGASAFPNQTFQSANYWVDVVFTATSQDTTPPTVSATTPANGATGVATGSSVTAMFSEAVDPTTVSGSTFQLRDASNNLVGATVTYDSASKTATLAPTAALASNTTYSARVVGGTNGVKDVAGNALAADFSWSFTTGGAGPCAAPANPIVAENCLTGNPASEWDVAGAGDSTIQGFATDISVNRGSTINFKVKTTAASYRIDIYRMGYYGGLGARKITTVQPSATLPQTQPACPVDTASKLMDCGNWAVSASWAVPATATSGIYIARLVRTDTGGASHMIFIVRDDASHSDILLQTSDTTWQAYNDYGNGSLYGTATTQFDEANRAFKVSYNRPFHTRETENGVSWVFNAEYPMVRWLEANGYDVTYFTGVDAARFGSLILNHKMYMPVGHDEYWSGPQRTNVEAARAAGINLAFFTGNGVFWKTRWENSIDGSNTAFRTLVSYKETHANAVIDPQDPPTWTGTWRDPRFSPPADGGRPENGLMGTIFMVNGPRVPPDSISVPAADGKMRFWRNTSIASLAAGQTATLPAGTLGFEWDVDADNGFRPAGLVRMSTTVVNITSDYLLDYGSVFGAGTANHALTLYRASSGALVFGAGTIQWSWGLDANHDHPNYAAPAADVRMQQATVNLLADMRAQPATLQAGLVAASASTDTAVPTSTITSPTAGASVPVGSPVTVSGSAADTGGGVVGGVEVSVDGGATWHPATGRASWTYTWTPAVAGSVVIKSRAADDSGNLETPSAGVTITVGTADTTPPTVTATTPTNGASGVSTNSTVTATFSEAIDPTTINGTTFELRDPANTLVPATVTYNGTSKVATLTPSAALAATTTYTARVKGGTTDPRVKDLAGNALAATVTWSFTTGTATPITLVGDTTVRSSVDFNTSGIAEAFQYTAVASGSATKAWVYVDGGNVATQVVVGLYTDNGSNSPGTLLAQATINSPTAGAWNSVALPPAAVSSGVKYWITVLGPAGGGPLRFRDVSSGGGRAQISAQSNLTSLPATWSAGTSYTDGPMSAYVVQDGAPDTTPPTVVATTPVSGATGVSADTSVSATFSEAIDPATIGTATFELRDPSNTLVGASVSYNATTSVATLAPASILMPSTTYTARIIGGSSGVKDTAGNALAATVTWTFTTAPATTSSPTVASLSPTSGSSAGGTVVTLTGTNFVFGATVAFGGTAATSITVLNSTSIRATTAAHAAGVVDVVVTNPGGASGTKTGGYTYLGGPTVTAISPASGSTVGGTLVTLTGTGFVAGATVSFGGAAGTSVTVVSATSITVKTPAHAAGSVNVTVTTSSGTSAPIQFTYVVRPIGDDNVEASQDNNPAGRAEAFQYTASASATITSLSIYIDTNSAATQVVVGIYSNNATTNNPDTLLAQAIITAPVKGAWNTVTVPAVVLTNGTKYWIAVLGPSGAGVVRFRDVSGGGRAQDSAQSTLTTLPATWTARNTYQDSPMSAYAQ
jgi:WD40 repeat protein